MVRIYSEQNEITFHKLLGEVNWDMELKNMKEVIFAFNQKITVAYNKSSRSKDCQSRKRAKDNPWISTGLKESIN